MRHAPGVGVHLWSFLVVAVVLVVTPGPDMALVTRNAVLHGRRVALGTALGVNAGLLIWTVAAALGVAAVVRASAIAFTVLKLVGAAYLVWLGLQALRARRRPHANPPAGSSRAASARCGFRQGLASNIANPKIAVLFTSLMPQFVSAAHPVLVPFLVLGGLFVALGLLWLSAYSLIASAAAGVLARPRVRAALDRITGTVLVALGVRLAGEHR
jgi:RhtB (resistance to homoserine/threonine) family protein